MHTRAVFLTGCLLLASAGCERPVITHATPPPLPASIDRLDPAVVALLRTRHAAVVADPANATEWRALALAAEANELFDTALACVTEAVRLDPGAPRGWYQLGRLATRAGDLDRAREAFETTARLAPAYAPALWRAGRVDLERGRFVEAEAAFERALAIDAALPAARIGLARAWLGQDRVAEAARLLEEESANADPAARPYTLHLLATARRRLGQRSDPSPAAAAPTWSDPWTSELATYRPGYGARIEAARRDLDAGRRAAAEATLRRLHAETPDNPVVTATLARVVRETGRPGEALALLDGIVAARPGFFPAHFERAVTLAQIAATLPPSEAEEARARA
ncbi:MAG: tetratricopeptide repeat protein, partial [Phycisphaerae bacterium]|nr:tetratricopeptide repeat protein [Phycisphaerae bacterium]